MRLLGFVITAVALAGLLVGQPLCCAMDDCCGRRPEAEQARSPKGVDAPCCSRCTAGEKHDEEPEPPVQPERCKCGTKKADFAQVKGKGPSPDGTPLAAMTFETVEVAPLVDRVVPTPVHAPPRAATALTLPLLL